MHSSKPKKTRIQLCGLCSLTVMQPSTNADLEWCSPWILTHLWSDVSECSSDAQVSYLFAFGSHIISCPVSPPLTLHIQLLVQCITVNSTGSSRPPSLLKKFRLTWLGWQFLLQSTRKSWLQTWSCFNVTVDYYFHSSGMQKGFSIYRFCMLIWRSSIACIHCVRLHLLLKLQAECFLVFCPT